MSANAGKKRSRCDPDAPPTVSDNPLTAARRERPGPLGDHRPDAARSCRRLPDDRSPAERGSPAPRRAARRSPGHRQVTVTATEKRATVSPRAWHDEIVSSIWLQINIFLTYLMNHNNVVLRRHGPTRTSYPPGRARLRSPRTPPPPRSFPGVRAEPAPRIPVVHPASLSRPENIFLIYGI